MKAKELIERLSKNPNLELPSVSISVFLNGKDEEEKKRWMIDYAKVFGKLKKGTLGNEIYLSGDIPGVDIKLWNYAECKIVGHKIRRQLVSRPAVPVEMIMVEEEIKVPVSNCQIENGEVDASEVVFSS